ncbi:MULTISPECIES: alginate lyase family protein [Yersinia]|uniref:alginate lyase family protein n=1 Tax=Yersinia TaxID=629 RepID=UPI0028F42F5B|nr:alginate lyase family protein [Yersinia sp. KBS0713]
MAVISLCKGRQFGINSLIFGAFFAGLILLFTFTAMPADAAQHEYAFLSAHALQHNKLAIAQKQASKETMQAYQRLLQQADRALKQPDQSVMEKSMMPPSGSKHDYLSLSAYWWPDSEKSDGLPQMSRRNGPIAALIISASAWCH